MASARLASLAAGTAGPWNISPSGPPVGQPSAACCSRPSRQLATSSSSRPARGSGVCVSVLQRPMPPSTRESRVAEGAAHDWPLLDGEADRFDGEDTRNGAVNSAVAGTHVFDVNGEVDEEDSGTSPLLRGAGPPSGVPDALRMSLGCALSPGSSVVTVPAAAWLQKHAWVLTSLPRCAWQAECAPRRAPAHRTVTVLAAALSAQSRCARGVGN